MISYARVVSLPRHVEVLAFVKLVLQLLLLQLILRHYILVLGNPDFTLHHLLVGQLRLDQVHLGTELGCLLQVLVISIHA